MKILIINLLLLLCLISSSGAFEIPSSCLTKVTTDCYKCSVQQNLNNGFFDNFLVLSRDFGIQVFIDQRVAQLQKANEHLKQSLIPLFRTLRDGSKEATFKESKVEIKSIKNDFDRLTVLSREAIILERKFNICLNNCGALRKLELQDDLVAIQKLKSALFRKQPILANKAFEKRMLKISDQMIDNTGFFPAEDFEKDLKIALFENLQKLSERQDQYDMFQLKRNNPIKAQTSGPFMSEYAKSISEKYPQMVEDIVNSTRFDGTLNLSEKKPLACLLATELKTVTHKKEMQELAVDTGLMLLPLLAGPVGIEVLFAERLAVWGIASNARTILSATSMLSTAGMSLKNLADLQEFSNKCKNKEVNFLSDSSKENFNSFKQCQKEYSEKVFISELGLIAGATTSIAGTSIKYLGKAVAELKIPLTTSRDVAKNEDILKYISENGLKELKKGQISLEFKTKDFGVFSVMDLKAIANSSDPALKSIPEEYWQYVSKIYNQRLNLSPEEIDSFIKSSLEMSSRTKLILNTEKSPLLGSMNTKGGVGIVEAVGNELLPFEKASNVKIVKKPGEKIAEIVRLTVGKGSDSGESAVELSKRAEALVDQAVTLITEDKSISRVFIFTSKVHSRVYKKMGIPADKMKDLDKRDILIEMTREELYQALQGRLQKRVSYMSNILNYLFTLSVYPNLAAA